MNQVEKCHSQLGIIKLLSPRNKFYLTDSQTQEGLYLTINRFVKVARSILFLMKFCVGSLNQMEMFKSDGPIHVRIESSSYLDRRWLMRNTLLKFFEI